MMNENKRSYRTPTGGESWFEVAPQGGDKGIDLTFSRSTQGELWVRLNWEQAESLGKSIAALIAQRQAAGASQ